MLRSTDIDLAFTSYRLGIPNTAPTLHRQVGPSRDSQLVQSLDWTRPVVQETMLNC